MRTFKHINIFGVRVGNFSRTETLRQITDALQGDHAVQVATVNAEFLLRADRDEEFKQVLNSCELSIPDATALHAGFWRRGERMLGKYPGADLMLDTLSLANQQVGEQMKVLLIVNHEGLSSGEEVLQEMQGRYPAMHFDVVEVDPVVGSEDMEAVLQEVREVGPVMVYANLGAPQQEYLLQKIKKDTIPSIRILMGVGGSFDYLTGKLMRAPQFMRSLGLEWLWRLLLQPKRIGRIVDAVIVFPYKVVFSKINQ